MNYKYQYPYPAIAADCMVFSDDNRKWVVPEKDEDKFLFKESDPHQVDFQPYPEVFLSTDRKEFFY